MLISNYIYNVLRVLFYSWIIVCVCFTSKLQAADSLVLLKKIPMQSTVFTTDKEGNVYCAFKNNTVYRYNENGDSTGYFSTVRRGKVTQIDASNPMRLMLYYADVPQLVMLNRMMSPVNTIDLKQVNIYNCPSISNSADGLIWAYNTLLTELVKIDDTGKPTAKSYNLLQQFQTNIQPIYITEQERNLFVVDSVMGILKFDAFGNYLTTYHFEAKEIQFVNNQLVYYSKGQMISYNTKTITEQKVNLPSLPNIINARIERNRIYVLCEDGLYIYKL
jgi:hypothetical protein